MLIGLKLLNDGKMPKKAHETDACFDCYANVVDEITLGVNERCNVPLGFAVSIPEGYEGIIRPRSGNSLHGLDVCIGTIDAGYTGEVSATVVNHDKGDWKIKKGDRISQLAIRPIPEIELIPVDNIADTERGSNGFGSTGK